MDMTDQTEADGAPAAGALDALTLKQREVLDLLIEYKTSKEISKVLCISPHTVDQRVDSAKAKLGASSRSDLAKRYRELLGADAPMYERLTYDDSYIVSEPKRRHMEPNASTVASQFSNLTFDGGGTAVLGGSERDFRVVPELFDGRWGTIARLVTILSITILLSIAFLGGLSMMMEVSNLMRR